MQSQLYTLPLSKNAKSKPVVLEFYTQRSGLVPVVFLHGINSGASSWQYQFEALLGIADCYAWNMPGYSQSTPYLDRPLAKDYAKLLYSWVSLQNFDQFILVGHSLGALIANTYANRYGDSLLGLMLVSPTRGYAHVPEDKQAHIASMRPSMMEALGLEHYVTNNTTRLANHLNREKLELVKQTIRRITLPGITASSNLLAYSQFDYTPVVTSLPNVILCGSLDTITPFEDVKAISEQINSPFIGVMEASHPCYLEQSDQFNTYLIQFIHQSIRASQSKGNDHV